MDAVRLDGTLAALADPTRRAIVARLSRGEATVMELAKPFAMSQPAISRHLKVLEGAGLIARRAEGTRRFCRLVPSALDEVGRWLEIMRRGMEANYGRLDAVLVAMKEEKEDNP